MLHYQKKRKIIFLTVLLGILAISLNGLGHKGKQPPSFRYALLDVENIDRIEMYFDLQSIPMDKPHGPRRVAVPMELTIDIAEAGTWESLADGATIWRLRVNTDYARFMSFKFSQFQLPHGAELYFVSVYRDYHVGPFTHRHNQPTRRFGSPVIAGDASVIELYLPEGSCEVALTLESVSHGYKNALGMGLVPYRQTIGAWKKEQLQPLARIQAAAFGCQRDINCPEGAPYQDVKRAVAEGYNGSWVCSGQLINNVREDNRYLYITAGHCEWYEDPSTMTYYWNYENSGCGTNDYPPFTYSTGSTSLFHVNSDTRDINLLELWGTDLENTYNIYFMGWNRGDAAPTMGAAIGFPDDKPKQIAIDNDPVTDCAIADCPNGWGPLFWRVDSWEVSVTQVGSSGSCLLDQDHLLVGVLSGGVGTNCNNFQWDEFYKLSADWSELQPFLDPDNTGAMWVPGKDGLSGGDQASNPNPADGATQVAVDTILSWTAGSGSDSSDVYFGTNPNPGSAEFQGNQAGTTFNPGTMTEDTTYYWRIDAVTGTNVVTGNVWSFTTTAGSTPDVVTITKAEWKASTQELKVEATSSEQPDATLTVEGIGTMIFRSGKYSLKKKPVDYPPTVTVTSSLGGSAVANVVIR